ncbi:hypothetical protein H9Y04_41335 [Streptomyces sp. TRM66268-LWL]|uniref:Uncharacterized protein n=1 Tax=Streptomyces polyasparticus TaxID=2767826 RepID=A0ABR7SWG3_9ACTN|nr:hypothetical protein [Streptomyces polyasparticus]MBC9718990.1 hypothetical protein [Streptomyces polyasparticus]
MTERMQDAEEARAALSTALRSAGISFPGTDLGFRPRPGAKTKNSYALIDLGAISAPVALKLAEVVSRGAQE